MNTPTLSLGLVLALAVSTPVRAQGLAAGTTAPNRPGTAATFTKDIAPIFQQKCQECHQPGSIAPMSLLTYEDAAKYAKRIRARVSARLMPPWHIDRTVGVQQFKNDRSLSDDQIDQIVSWVDAGMPRGDPADLPSAPKFVDPNRWQLADQLGAQPDLVVRSTPYTLAARTQDKWFRPVIETGLTEARWVKAIEVKPVRPADRKIVHHALMFLLQDEKEVTGLASSAHEHQANAGLFMEWAVG